MRSLLLCASRNLFCLQVSLPKLYLLILSLFMGVIYICHCVPFIYRFVPYTGLFISASCYYLFAFFDHLRLTFPTAFSSCVHLICSLHTLNTFPFYGRCSLLFSNTVSLTSETAAVAAEADRPDYDRS